jgi:hypothetical protein
MLTNSHLTVITPNVCACRHPNDELNYCYYLIPCGKAGYCGDVTESDLAKLHNDAITKVRAAPARTFQIEHESGRSNEERLQLRVSAASRLWAAAERGYCQLLFDPAAN